MQYHIDLSIEYLFLFYHFIDTELSNSDKYVALIIIYLLREHQMIITQQLGLSKVHKLKNINFENTSFPNLFGNDVFPQSSRQHLN